MLYKNPNNLTEGNNLESSIVSLLAKLPVFRVDSLLTVANALLDYVN